MRQENCLSLKNIRISSLGELNTSDLVASSEFRSRNGKTKILYSSSMFLRSSNRSYSNAIPEKIKLKIQRISIAFRF